MAQVPRLADGDLGGTVTSVENTQVKLKTIANEPFTIVFDSVRPSSNRLERRSP
jgi:hypothetical protein